MTEMNVNVGEKKMDLTNTLKSLSLLRQDYEKSPIPFFSFFFFSLNERSLWFLDSEYEGY